MEKYYHPYYNGKPLPVKPMIYEPIVGANIDFSSYHLNYELPAIKFKVVGLPIKIVPLTYSYSGAGWSNDYERYSFAVDVEGE